MTTRATKIVATLGPASSAPEVLERLLRAGVDTVRLNFSHGKAETTSRWPRWCAKPPSASASRWR